MSVATDGRPLSRQEPGEGLARNATGESIKKIRHNRQEIAFFTSNEKGLCIQIERTLERSDFGPLASKLTEG